MVRTQDDGWIVGRKSDQREFYVIFDQKNANLLEVNGMKSPPFQNWSRRDAHHLSALAEEVRKLSSTYFNNIFIE